MHTVCLFKTRQEEYECICLHMLRISLKGKKETRYTELPAGRRTGQQCAREVESICTVFFCTSPSIFKKGMRNLFMYSYNIISKLYFSVKNIRYISVCIQFTKKMVMGVGET